jgi:trk system potassium uptake protein
VSRKLQVAVLGLGRFGSAVARELTQLGHDVLAVDLNEKTVQDIADDVTHAAQADITELDALKALGIAHFDVAVVGVSESLEVSVLASALLKQLGVPRILAKAANDLHGQILKQVGVAQVVYPEVETAARVAHSLAARGIEGYIPVAPEYGIARVRVANTSMGGKSLRALDLWSAYRVAVIALVRKGAVTLNPSDSEVLQKEDELIVAGFDDDLERIPGTSG